MNTSTTPTANVHVSEGTADVATEHTFLHAEKDHELESYDTAHHRHDGHHHHRRPEDAVQEAEGNKLKDKEDTSGDVDVNEVKQQQICAGSDDDDGSPTSSSSSSSSSLSTTTSSHQRSGLHYFQQRLLYWLIYFDWSDGTLLGLKTDLFAGITLAMTQVAPAVAFALIAHMNPLHGLYTSFFVGIICAIFGGRPGMISGSSGAMVVLYAPLVDKHGPGALVAASILSGFLMTIPGFTGLAKYVRMLPISVMIGFVDGLGIVLAKGQVPGFRDEKKEFVTGQRAGYTALLCILAFLIMVLLPRFTTIVPSTFVALIVGTILEHAAGLGTVTVGGLYTLSGAFPSPQLPDIPFGNLPSALVTDVIVMAILQLIVGVVESLMTAHFINTLTETDCNFEVESITLGVSNIVAGFFGTFAGCGLVGPSILNAACGGAKRRISLFICAMMMIIVVLVASPAINLMPMGTLSAVVFFIAMKTFDWKTFELLFCRRMPIPDMVVVVVMVVVTVEEDLAVAVAAGLGLSMIFFTWDMARGRLHISLSHAHSNPYRPVASTTATTVSTKNPSASSLTATKSAASAAASPSSSSCALLVNADDTVGVCAQDVSFLRRRKLETKNNKKATSATPPPPPAAAVVVKKNNLKTHVVDDLVVCTRRHPEHEREDNEENTHTQEEVDGEGEEHEEILVRIETCADADMAPDVRAAVLYGRGVLFFGSCIEFQKKCLHLLEMIIEANAPTSASSSYSSSSSILVGVTDIILDFGFGDMTVHDFSAIDTLNEIAGHFKRHGLRAHLRNLDPGSGLVCRRCRNSTLFNVQDDDIGRYLDRGAPTRRETNVCYLRATTTATTTAVTTASTSTNERGEENTTTEEASTTTTVAETVVTIPTNNKTMDAAGGDAMMALLVPVVVARVEEVQVVPQGLVDDDTCVRFAKAAAYATHLSALYYTKKDTTTATTTTTTTTTRDSAPDLNSSPPREVLVGFDVFVPGLSIVARTYRPLAWWASPKGLALLHQSGFSSSSSFSCATTVEKHKNNDKHKNDDYEEEIQNNRRSLWQRCKEALQASPKVQRLRYVIAVLSLDPPLSFQNPFIATTKATTTTTNMVVTRERPEEEQPQTKNNEPCATSSSDADIIATTNATTAAASSSSSMTFLSSGSCRTCRPPPAYFMVETPSALLPEEDDFNDQKKNTEASTTSAADMAAAMTSDVPRYVLRNRVRKALFAPFFYFPSTTTMLPRTGGVVAAETPAANTPFSTILPLEVAPIPGETYWQTLKLRFSHI